MDAEETESILRAIIEEIQHTDTRITKLESAARKMILASSELSAESRQQLLIDLSERPDHGPMHWLSQVARTIREKQEKA